MLQLTDIEVLARTIYGEARGEYQRQSGGIAALIAIGNVIMNRIKLKTWFGSSVREVCLKPWQFSCWNKQDPNYQILMRSVIEDSLYGICTKVAMNLIAEKWPDLTKAADHYHAVTMTTWPQWTSGRKPAVIIGAHAFYQLGGK